MPLAGKPPMNFSPIKKTDGDPETGRELDSILNQAVHRTRSYSTRSLVTEITSIRSNAITSTNTRLRGSRRARDSISSVGLSFCLSMIFVLWINLWRTGIAWPHALCYPHTASASGTQQKA
jgi:hypothetical protein